MATDAVCKAAFTQMSDPDDVSAAEGLAPMLSHGNPIWSAGCSCC